MTLRLPAALVLIAAMSAPASADPYRLRASALAQSRSPVGLVVLDADGKPTDWLSAEALVWTGAGGDSEADVLVVAVHARSHDRKEQATLGRFILVAGALRPVQIDGVRGRLRLPQKLSLEVFGGVPVLPEYAPRAWDWLAGGRVSRQLGDYGGVGIAYMHRRDHGRLSDEELALDAGAAATKTIDLASRFSYDLINTGLSEVQLTSRWKATKAWRFEIYGNQRSPSRILPATSLFSVLGDVASRNLGGACRWRAAPRLDLSFSGGARQLGDEYGLSLDGRALLRLDDRGKGALSLEGRRETSVDGAWSGVRAAARVPVTDGWNAAAELELVAPDDPRGRGRVWPWGLVGVRWQPARLWEASAALEASASPEYTSRLDAMVTVSRSWEVTP